MRVGICEDAVICHRCGKETSIENLVKNKSKLGGATNLCHECANVEATEKRRRKRYNIGHPVPLPGFRICRKCGKMTPYDLLVGHKDAKDGIRSLCKSCARVQTKHYELEHAEQIREARKRHYQETRERYCSQVKQYAKEHPEIGKKSRKRYFENNKQKWRQYGKTRRARELNAPGYYTKTDVLHQYNSQRGLCFWCSNPMSMYHEDHYFPLTRGGTNWPDNIVLSCPFCNQSKNNRIPFEEWQPPNALIDQPLPKTERRFQRPREAKAEAPQRE